MVVRRLKPWSDEEEDALTAGVAKHGEGKWTIILKDTEFGPILHLRSNTDLKNKWRSLKVPEICSSRKKWILLEKEALKGLKDRWRNLNVAKNKDYDPEQEQSASEEEALRVCFPEQKRSSSEEESLKAGTTKYGERKWSKNLNDAELGPILHFRSNVDLKDKWTNLNVAENKVCFPEQKRSSSEEESLKAGTTKYREGKWSKNLSDAELAPILHFRSNVDLKDKWTNLNVAENKVCFPEQKRSSSEEGSFKSGTAKYGEGKWSKNLNDAEFGPILHFHSNVDLKDKWRNLNVAENKVCFPEQKRSSLEEESFKAGTAMYGEGNWNKNLDAESRAFLHFRSNVDIKDKWRNLNVTENKVCFPDSDMAINAMVKSGLEVVDAPQPCASGTSKVSEPDSLKKPMSRLDNLILNAIAKLKEPRRSCRAAIATQLKEKYIAPPDSERLDATLNLLTERGNLVEVKHHQYKIVPSTSALGVKTDFFKFSSKRNRKSYQKWSKQKQPSFSRRCNGRF